MNTSRKLPESVSASEWFEARLSLLSKEKALTAERDALNAERRRMPMVRIDKFYEFDTETGPLTLLDLFEGRDQLVIHHFMFAPSWETPCPSCSSAADGIGNIRQLHARNTSLVAVSRAPIEKLIEAKTRMGWKFPWVSSLKSDFNYDFHATLDDTVAPVMLHFKTSEEIANTGTPWSKDQPEPWSFGNPRGYTSTTPTSISTISANEPFVYLHMFVGGNLTFNKVELSGQGFEFDNLTVSDQPQTPNPRLVLVSETLQIGLNTVQFNGNATGVEGTMSRMVGSTAAALTTNTLTRPGYTFGGWTTAADGTGTAYADAASYPFTSSTTLYAKWNPINYTVAYNTQGGSTVTGGNYTIGSSITLPAAPTRNGFTFAGWFTGTSGGTALGATYSPPSTGNITLYAQWTPNLATTGANSLESQLLSGTAAGLFALGALLLWIRRRFSN